MEPLGGRASSENIKKQPGNGLFFCADGSDDV